MFIDWFTHTKTYLGVYSELCSEAVHCNFKKTSGMPLSKIMKIIESSFIKVESSYSNMRI